MKRHIKIASITLAIVLIGAASAFADETIHAFDDVMPPLQQSHYLGAYIRSTSTTASQIKFSVISDNQLMNAKTANLQTGAQYLELKGIGVNNDVHVENKTPVGYSSRFIVTNYEWNVLSPTIKGTELIH